MTIDEILKLEPEQLAKFNRKELSKIVSQAASAANKRISRLEEKNLVTPSLMKINRSGGKFSVAGKNLNQLRSEYVRVSGFLRAKTSTVTGAKKVQAEVEKRIGGALTPSEMKDFWSAYHKVEELEPNFLKLYGSQQMQQYLRNETVASNKDVDELVKQGIDEINRKYEEKMEGEVDEMEEFFEI